MGSKLQKQNMFQRVKRVASQRKRRPNQQGSLAAKRGIFYEQTVESIIEANGGVVTQWNNIGSVDLESDTIAVRNVPCTAPFGGRGKADFVLLSDKVGEAVRIEVRTQTVSGSADEKLMYVMESCIAAEERCAIIVMEGEGFRKGARDWMTNKAASVGYKDIRIMTMDEFKTWASLYV